MRREIIPFVLAAAATAIFFLSPPPGGWAPESENPARRLPDQPAQAISFHVLRHAGPGVHEIPTQYILDELAKIRSGKYGIGKTQLVSWNEAGPDNVGGRTRAILIDPTTSSTMYAAAVGGGVWKSTDAGANWSTTTDALGNIAFTTLAMAPGGSTTARTIYGGTGEGYFNIDAIAGAGLYKSFNSGGSWTQIQPTSVFGGNRYINKVAVDPTDSNYVYVAANNGLYRSANAGASFTAIGGFSGQVQEIAINPAGPDTMYVTVYGSGVYRCGAVKAASPSFTNVRSHTGQGRSTIELAPSKPSVLYALFTTSGGEPLAIEWSGNAGASWNAGTIPVNDDNNLSSFMNTQGWYDCTIAVNPSDEKRIYVGGVDSYTSGNGGSTWTKMTSWEGLNAPYSHADIHAISFVSSNSFYIASDGGISVTGNGGSSWSASNTGYNVTQFYYVAQSNTGATYIGGTQDNGTLKAAGGLSWNTIDGGDGGASLISHTNSNDMFSSYVFGYFFYSVNGGSSWSNAYPNTAGSNLNFLFIAPAEMSPSVATTVFLGGRIFYKSTNNGTSWSNLLTLTSSTRVSAIGLSVSADTILLGIENGSTRRSTNAGGSWVATTPTGATYITDAEIAFSNSNVAYVTANGYKSGQHVFKTTNLGSATPTWTDVSAALPALPAMSVGIDRYDPNHVLVGMEAGIFESTNGGSSWTAVNAGFAPGASTEDIDIRYDGNIIAGTHGRGAFTSAVPLPVELTAFRAARSGSSVKLFWNTATEKNNYGFNVQRWDGNQWIDIGFVEGDGTTDSPRSYSFTDPHPLPAGARYRLEQVDRDGTRAYSPERSVDMSLPEGLAILDVYPSPASASLGFSVQYFTPDDSGIRISVRDIAGRELYRREFPGDAAGIHSAQIPANTFPSGNYILMLSSATSSAIKLLCALR